MMMLGYRPFFDSLELVIPHLSDYWLLTLVPLVVAICIVYKGTKVPAVAELPVAAGKMAVQILIAMALAAVALTAIYLLITRAM